MPRDEKRRQKSLQKHAAKRKQKQKSLHSQSAAGRSAMPSLRAAAAWPLHECLITSSWEQPGEIVQILVARRSGAGDVAAATFLVDLGCLGVKSAFGRIFESKRDYEEELRQSMTGMQAMKKVDLNLVAKVIRDSIKYAADLGFRPDPDYHRAAVLLEGADPDAAREVVPLGVDGKPFFIAGPHDNVRVILSTLERAVGPTGFGPLTPGPPMRGSPFDRSSIELLPYSDDDDDDEDDDDEGIIDV